MSSDRLKKLTIRKQWPVDYFKQQFKFTYNNEQKNPREVKIFVFLSY